MNSALPAAVARGPNLSAARIKQRYKRWEECEMLDTLYVRTKQDEAVEVMAEAARLNAPR